MTMEEMRQSQTQKEKAAEIEKERLAEEVMVVNLTFPPEMQRNLGVSGVWMKLEELPAFLEEEFDNEEYGLFTVKVKRKTNKWIENLPEADY